ncbi:MAG: RNA methyltransferase, partial [Ignavibacteria bacterium]|nr:RNA methyltransferase [Ignavibacteria bacterium]
VHLVYTNEVFPEISKESSVSAKKWMKIIKHKSYGDCASYLHKNGFKIGASHLDKYSLIYDEINYLENIALVFGNEHRGVSDDMLAVSDFSFKIPMHGMIQSLNVSVAAAVTLYEAEKQRRKNGFYDELQINQDEYQNILLDWLLR